MKQLQGRDWALAGAVGLVVLAVPVCAQLRAERLYCGVGRAIPVRVERPAGVEGEIALELIAPDGVPVASAPGAEGVVNLATLFPVIWTSPEPKFLYAQLSIGGTRTGAPLVLQPMKGTGPAQMTDAATGAGLVISGEKRTPNFSTRDAVIAYPQSDKVFAGVRVYEDRTVVFTTTLGEIEFLMRPDCAPNTAFNFLHLVDGGFYTDVIFHRIVGTLPNGNAFVIQTGDPTGTGDGGPGYAIDLEPSTLQHDFGVLSMARDDDPDTNGSQVFVALSREGTKRLDGRYTAFGEVVRGAGVVRAIAAVKVEGAENRPVDPPRIVEAKSVPAPPFGKRPTRDPGAPSK